ncbi:Helitron helicase [Phytophthora megakarya]|uniref:Helitron helicase n=1 Tax=Phytophthora megakarya TaxID=4795 RepID=A0A225UJI4_9STRA|nr:Helitron helicase [Phytophthora megakarya]
MKVLRGEEFTTFALWELFATEWEHFFLLQVVIRCLPKYTLMTLTVRHVTTLTPNIDQPWKQLEQNVHDAKKKSTRKLKKEMKRIVNNMRLKTRKTSETKKKRLIDSEVDCELRLQVGHGTNLGTHNTPTASEVAAVIIDANAAQSRDIVLYTRQGGFNRIYETNLHYDPLQYPLLHPYGESGWAYKLSYASEQNSDNDGDDEGRANHSQNDQNMEEELGEWGYIVQYEDGSEGRRKTTMSLREFTYTQQYCVDQRSKAEQGRLRYIENNQLKFRLETIQGLTDAYRHEGTEAHRVAAMYELEQTAQDSVTCRERQQNTSNGTIEPDANDVGRRLILPPSFTGGPRYMYQRFMDAMAIVRELGAPNLFITYTCNPKWVEIKENLRPGQTAADRPDIVARVFMQNVESNKQ